jgi:hypothetical protein
MTIVLDEIPFAALFSFAQRVIVLRFSIADDGEEE